MLMHSEIIIEFHKRRTNAHIAGVNYFADILGMQFPMHDSDKFAAPLLMPYSMKNYLDYHADFEWTDSVESEWERANWAHHHAANHHPESYADISDMPAENITEMVCDWFSANNEQKLIRNISEYPNVMDFYTRFALPEFGFTTSQQKAILKLIDDLESRAVTERFLDIWREFK